MAVIALHVILRHSSSLAGVMDSKISKTQQNRQNSLHQVQIHSGSDPINDGPHQCDLDHARGLRLEISKSSGLWGGDLRLVLRIAKLPS